MIIIQFGGEVFVRASLTGVHWTVCTLCESGTLLWDQLIPCILMKKQAYYTKCLYLDSEMRSVN